MVEYAEAITLAGADRRIGGEALALLERALEIDPQHQRALWFLGIERFQSERWAEAAALWERLLPLVPVETRATLLTQINQARDRAGQTPLEHAAGEPVMTVTIDLAPALQSRLGAGDTLYVFARQPDGPAMPLAVKRLPAAGFPRTVALSDADSPMPTLKLSGQSKIRLVARISKSGDAGARPGDLEAAPLDVELAPGAGYALRIDRVVE
jgi:cytochrome c-type biogenesis protein CcmH